MDGQQLLLTGNRKHFYYYDLGANKLEKVNGIQGGVFANSSASSSGEALSNLSKLFTATQGDLFALAGGDSGSLAVLSQKTKKLLFELKLSSSSCSSIAFGPGPDPRRIYAVGDQAEIYVWDIRHTKKCVAKIADEGSFNTTHLAISQDGTQVATGSHSGVVNVYRTSDDSEGQPLTLVKSLMNLTTAISDLSFDSTGQLLGVCSKWKKNAVRLIHTGAGGTFTAF